MECYTNSSSFGERGHYEAINLVLLNTTDWATRTIYFDRKIDLIPYYPYIIAMSYYSDEKAIIFIADESFIDQEEKLLREYKSIGDREESPMVNYYRRALADEYIKVAKEMLEKEKEKM